jgi:hypothetical protein
MTTVEVNQIRMWFKFKNLAYCFIVLDSEDGIRHDIRWITGPWVGRVDSKMKSWIGQYTEVCK